MLDSESFSSAIGDNKTVDLTFSTQIGGPEQEGVGVFISGFENVHGADSKYKMSPSIETNATRAKLWNNTNRATGEFFAPYGKNGTSGIYNQASTVRGSWVNYPKDSLPTGAYC
mgnify:FL=1